MRDVGKPWKILLCEDSLDGILTGVYEAYQSGYGHDNIRLYLAESEYEIELFSEYQEVVANTEKASRMMGSILERIGKEARQNVLEASYSVEPDKAEVVYRYLVYGYAMGGKVLHCLSEPYVKRMFAICKRMRDEVSDWKESLHFQMQKNGMLMASITPKANVIAFLMPYFAECLSDRDFIIYDKTHDKVGIHIRKKGWFLK